MMFRITNVRVEVLVDVSVLPPANWANSCYMTSSYVLFQGKKANSPKTA